MAWENFDEELQKRLGASVNAGFRQATYDKYGWAGGGRDGLTRKKTGTGTYTDIKYYKNNEDWQKVARSLGLASVNSMNDLNQMFDFVNMGRYGGGSKKEEAPVEETENPNKDQRNEPTVSYNPDSSVNPDSTVVEGKNQETKLPSEDTGPSRMDPNNLNRWGVNAGRFGMRDLLGAYSSGYSVSDINNWLSTQPTFDNPHAEGGGYNPRAPWHQGMKEVASGQVSTKFFNPDVAAYDPGGNGGTDFFGHADLLANRKGGLSDYQILTWLDNNQNRLRPKNKKGVAGGIYEELNSMRPVDPKNLLTGGSNLGNAGYADAVKPNRSKASQSTRSSYGTSQYNRANFGNAVKSGISMLGLNI